MQDLERAYDAMITAFACILALFFLNVRASLCVLILKGGVVQRTPTRKEKLFGGGFVWGEGLFIERTSPLATTKPSTRKPARLAII
jgi:hypothetical protein